MKCCEFTVGEREAAEGLCVLFGTKSSSVSTSESVSCMDNTEGIALVFSTTR